ncbi:hypothetical protein [Streptomyces sp.]|uniref:hypothetical protein n=1 Tax=Streptomyces sp. TaxID=1931 RepID=UPI002F424D0F
MAETPEAAFERHRSVLTGLAHRLLSGMWDAEDVVREAYPRWTRAALRPVVGRSHMIPFLPGQLARHTVDHVRPTEANGLPALRPAVGGHEQTTFLDVRDGRIHGVFAVLNPDKLTRLSEPGTDP